MARPGWTKIVHAAKHLVDRWCELSWSGRFDAAANLLADFWFDLRNGTRTTGRIDLRFLEIRSTNKDVGVEYAPTRVRPFRKLMHSISFPPDSVLVDLGCGKGRIVLLAMEHKFKRIVGLEFSPELCEIAKNNLTTYKRRHRDSPPAVIHEVDVADYAVEPDENVFFIFNAFGAPVLCQFLNNLDASVQDNPRQVFLIYHKPVLRQMIESTTVLSLVSSFHIFHSNDSLLYSNGGSTHPGIVRANHADRTSYARLENLPPA